MNKRTSWRWLAILALAVLAVSVAACDPPQAQIFDFGATPTDTVTPAPTATPRPISTVTGESYQCPDPTSTDPSYIHDGDIRITAVQFALAYPSVLLPNTTAGKPYRLPPNTATLSSPPVNPNVTEPGGGYGFTICNTSTTTAHVIDDVLVKIEQFVPYTDTASTWQFCDGFYQRPAGAVYGGCGGAFPADEAVHATFATDATTGAVVTATPSISADTTTTATPTTTPAPTPSATPSDGSSDGATPPLPISLAPGQQLIVNVGLTPPAQSGTYTFGFYLVFDNGVPVPISTMAPTLFDSAATKWTAQACTTMVTQIPSADSTGKYVCQEQP